MNSVSALVAGISFDDVITGVLLVGNAVLWFWVLRLGVRRIIEMVGERQHVGRYEEFAREWRDAGGSEDWLGWAWSRELREDKWYVIRDE